MANLNTSIEWCDATWSPVTGCTKVSAGCRFCYAERVFPRAYGKERKFTDVRCHPERLEQPLHWRKPRRIFVNSMSDLFHEDVPFEFIFSVFNTMAACEWHTFQCLTKRPKRMLEWFEWLEKPNRHGEPVRQLQLMGDELALTNVWLGVSVENQRTADERIPLLLQTPAAVRFISYEPALAPVDFSRWMHPFEISRTANGDDLGSASGGSDIDWVIGGSESGPQARDYETEWFANVARQCEQAGVAFFMKQLTVRGRKIPFEEWPGYLKVREYPTT